MSDVRKHVTYTLTEDEFVRAFVQARRRNKKRFWFFVFTLLAAAALLNVDSISKEPFDLVRFLSLNFIFLPCLLLTLFVLEQRRLRKIRVNFRTSPLQGSEVVTKWDETGLTVTNPDGFQLCRWSDFSGWTEDNVVITLFYGPSLYIPCPKRAFDEEQKRDFIQQMQGADLVNLKLMPF